ncbi:hypothetical protein [Verminephrobacter eiseniae]|uniref:hypothetical protein n=1 Tax=Verminephrobacter eiseniae TaxID=364317 RepID=UPI0022378B0E|nr:hypothetical protein [Verminephrobacter eiseniae]
MSRHRSSVGLRWPSKRSAALQRLPIRSVWAARCALRCAPMAARSLRHLIRDATLAPFRVAEHVGCMQPWRPPPSAPCAAHGWPTPPNHATRKSTKPDQARLTRLTCRATIGGAIRAIVTAGRPAGEMRDDRQPHIAATVIAGGFMEGRPRAASSTRTRMTASTRRGRAG